MTWNLKHAGIPNSATTLYDSPFAASSAKYAIGSSKINHGVAQYLYPAESVRTSLNIQSAPMPSKNHSMRYTLDANSVTNYIPGAVLTAKDAYERSIQTIAESYKKEKYTLTTTINSSDDFRKLAHKNYKLIDDVVRKMMVNSSAILQHKVYGTELPAWYIHKMCFLMLLEQAMADEYGDETVNKKAISSPMKALDMIQAAYNNANVEKRENWSLFKKDDETEVLKIEIPSDYSDVSIPEQYRQQGVIEVEPSMKFSDEEIAHIKRGIALLNESLSVKVSDTIIDDGKASSVESLLQEYGPAYKTVMSSDIPDDKKYAIYRYIVQLIETITPKEVVEVHDEEAVVVTDKTPQPIVDEIKTEVVAEGEPITLAPVVRESCLMKLAAVDAELLKMITTTIYKEQTKPLMIIDAPVKVDNDSKTAAIKDEIEKIEVELKKLDSKSGFIVNLQKKILQARLDELKAKLSKESWINHRHGVVPSWKGVRGRNERYSISGVTRRTPWPTRLGVPSLRKENFGSGKDISIIVLIVIIVILCIYVYKSMKKSKNISVYEGGDVWD